MRKFPKMEENNKGIGVKIEERRKLKTLAMEETFQFQRDNSRKV